MTEAHPEQVWQFAAGEGVSEDGISAGDEAGRERVCPRVRQEYG